MPKIKKIIKLTSNGFSHIELIIAVVVIVVLVGVGAYVYKHNVSHAGGFNYTYLGSQIPNNSSLPVDYYACAVPSTTAGDYTVDFLVNNFDIAQNSGTNANTVSTVGYKILTTGADVVSSSNNAGTWTLANSQQTPYMSYLSYVSNASYVSYENAYYSVDTFSLPFTSGETYWIGVTGNVELETAPISGGNEYSPSQLQPCSSTPQPIKYSYASTVMDQANNGYVTLPGSTQKYVTVVDACKISKNTTQWGPSYVVEMLDQVSPAIPSPSKYTITVTGESYNPITKHPYGVSNFVWEASTESNSDFGTPYSIVPRSNKTLLELHTSVVDVKTGAASGGGGVSANISKLANC